MMDWHDRSVPLLAVTISMSLLALMVVPLRCYARISKRSFKIDDTLILVALVFRMGACAVTLWGFSYGLGVEDKYLKEGEGTKGTEAFAIFKPIYVVSNALIKCSICFTYLRLAIDRPLQIALYIIMGTVAASSSIMFIGSFLYCVPYTAIWLHWKHPHTPGYCLPGDVVLAVAYFFASTTIITDLCCAAVPGIILWNSMMKPGTKIMAYVILSLGVLAGFATICRLPFIDYWVYNQNRSYGLGMIMLFELLECGLGFFASCAPALKPLLLQGVSLCSTLFQRLSLWSSIAPNTYDTEDKYDSIMMQGKLQQQQQQQQDRQQEAPPTPRLALVIPEPEDTVAEDEDEIVGGGQARGKMPIIVVREIEPTPKGYTDGWDIV